MVTDRIFYRIATMHYYFPHLLKFNLPSHAGAQVTLAENLGDLDLMSFQPESWSGFPATSFVS